VPSILYREKENRSVCIALRLSSLSVSDLPRSRKFRYESRTKLNCLAVQINFTTENGLLSAVINGRRCITL